jgi:hypothetical protein
MERRAGQRTNLDVFLNKVVSGETHLCRGVNLSVGGLLVHKVFEPDRPLGEVTVEFQLPGCDKVIRVGGVTLAEHSGSRAQAIRFTRISAEDADLIGRFLDGTMTGVVRQTL